MENSETFDFIEILDISHIVMDNLEPVDRQSLRPALSLASPGRLQSCRALARRGHTVGLLEGWKAEGLQWLWLWRGLQWRGTVP